MILPKSESGLKKVHTDKILRNIEGMVKQLVVSIESIKTKTKTKTEPRSYTGWNYDLKRKNYLKP